jgi:ubiquinone/menaquinone biosynthesis C-methylase UbiE
VSESAKHWGAVAQVERKLQQIGNNSYDAHHDLKQVIAEKKPAAAKIGQLLKVSKDAVGMDIGCGIGAHAVFFAGVCKQLYTIDVTDNFLDLYNEVVGNIPNVTRFVSNNFPMFAQIPDQSLDFAYSSAVFCHLNVYDVYCYFEELSTKLKSGGRFYVNFQNSDHLDFSDPFPLFLSNYKNGGTMRPIPITGMQLHGHGYFIAVGRKFGMDVTYQAINNGYSEMVLVRR